MKRRVLITGGTGFVGSHAVEAYLAAGWTVQALVRNPRNLSWLADLPIEVTAGQYTDLDSLRNAVQDVDLIVHCAAVTKTPRRADYYLINATGVSNLTDAARDAGVKRFVLCSTHAASGPATDGVSSHESDAPQPLTDYGRSKLQGERDLQERAGNMEWLILRPPSILGPRDEQFVPLFRAVSKYGIYPIFGRGRQSYSYVFVRDFVRALLLAGQTDRGLNEVYFVAHDEPIDWREAAQQIASFAGRKARAIWIPGCVMRGLGAVNDTAAALTGNTALLSSDKVRELLTQGWVCSSEKILSALGFSCKYSTERALGETYAFYQATNRI